MLRRIPLAIPAAACALGAASAEAVSEVPTLALATLLLLSALAILSPRPRAVTQALLLVLPFWIGVVAVTGESAEDRPSTSATGEGSGPTTLSARVVTAPRPVRSTRFRSAPAGVREPAPLRMRTEIESAAGERLTLLYPAVIALGRGAEIRVTGKRDGALLVAQAGTIDVVAIGGFLARCDRLRDRLRESWRQNYDPVVAGWWSALLLGERALLPDDVAPRFRRVGLSHMIAISGLHVGILSSLFLIPLRRWRRLATAVAALLVATLIAAYAAVAGGDAPVVRAAILVACAAIAVVRGRRPALLNTLAVAFLLLMSIDGGSVDSVGLQLSFAAVAAIALTPRADQQDQESRGLFRRTAAALRISFAAWWGASIPLIWYSAEVVPWGPPLTLLSLPLIVVLLATGLLSLCPGADSVAPLLSTLAHGSIQFLDGATQWVDRWPATPACWPPLPPVVLMLIVAGVGLFLRRDRRPLAAALLVLACVGLLAPISRCEGELVSLGRGQSLLLIGTRGALLYDAGSLDASDGGARSIQRALWLRGRDHVDALFLSHPHADHLNAVPSLLRHVSVGCVVVGPRFGEVALGAAILRHLDLVGVRVESVCRGDRVDVGDWRCRVLHPPAKPLPKDSLNDDSVVVRVRGSGLDALLCGDIEEVGMAATSVPAGLDVLLLPHHGRPCPSLESWLRHAPARCYVAASTRGLPAPTAEVVGRLERPYFATAYRTAVILIRRDYGWTVHRQRR